MYITVDIYYSITCMRDNFTEAACSSVSNSSTSLGMPFLTKMEQPPVSLPATSDTRVLKSSV